MADRSTLRCGAPAASPPAGGGTTDSPCGVVGAGSTSAWSAGRMSLGVPEPAPPPSRLVASTSATIAVAARPSAG